ncbi:MAG: sigma-70 family RNA polymerase sigma factor [Opitutaceae bacterium]|nr:sigma-70 family RNA polymerase sigma factor [Opitutaceae bacterium]
MEATHEGCDTWRSWLEAHGPQLLLCARQWTRSLADAEDVVQEAFVRYWRHQRHLPGDPRALLVTSIRRAALDLARRESRRQIREQRAGEDQAGVDPWFEASASDAGRREGLEAALRHLPPEQREVLVLKVWNELTFEQIAAALEISPHTAASRYRYGIAALRKELNPVCHG